MDSQSVKNNSNLVEIAESKTQLSDLTHSNILLTAVKYFDNSLESCLNIELG